MGLFSLCGEPGSPDVRSGFLLPGKSDSTAAGLNEDVIVLCISTLEDLHGERVFEVALDRPFQRAGPEDWVVAGIDEKLSGTLADMEGDITVL